MPAPVLTAFGDNSHILGETGLTVTGAGLGAIPTNGSLWMFENADGSGAADQLTFTGGHNMGLTGVSIPSSPNNTVGTVYLRYQRVDLAWSNTLAFTITSYDFTLTSQTFSWTDYAPTVVYGQVVTLTQETFAWTDYAVSVNAETSLTTTLQSFTWTDYAATVTTTVIDLGNTSTELAHLGTREIQHVG